MKQMINLTAPVKERSSLRGYAYAFFRKPKSGGRIFFLCQCDRWTVVSPVLEDGAVSRNGRVFDTLSAFAMEEVEIILREDLGIAEIRLADD